LSNIPEPCGSVVQVNIFPGKRRSLPRQVPKPLKPATSDAATRTWPRLHGRMLGHRVNSEGLRRRATARGGGAPKRTYIVFGRHNCQPSEPRNKPCGSRKSGNFCRLSRIGGEPRRGLAIALVETGLAAGIRVFGHCCAALRPYSSAFFARSCRDVATRGKRQRHLRLPAFGHPVALTVGGGRGIVFQT
jgi:hypothetical protein